MRRESSLIKNFSKEKNQEERDETARRIRERRAEYFSNKKDREKWENEKGNVQLKMESNDLEIQKKVEELNKLRDEIKELSSNLPKKLWNYFKLKKLESKLAIGEKSYKELEIWHNELLEQENFLENNLSEKNISHGKEEAQNILYDFYDQQEREWRYSDYTKEEICKYFSEENLASLSMKDYVLLLEKFSDKMVTHITRQGIRDHVGHIYHTAGEGEYADGFMKILEDGRLRSSLGIYLAEGMKESNILNFLKKEFILEDGKTREEVLEKLEMFASGKGADMGNCFDSLAVHFATEEVANAYYGSEKGNEIFIVYPSMHIASQYFYQGQLEDRGGGYWNDQWVWANEEKGMDLNAGLVFIPEEVRVDRKTGSRYKLDTNSNPIKNLEYKKIIKEVVNSNNFYNFSEQIKKIIYEIRQNHGSISLELEEQKIKEALAPFIKKVKEEFNIVDEKLLSIIFNYGNLNNFIIEKRRQEMGGKENEIESIDFEIEKALRAEGILYLEAENTISSKEFWENYFQDHLEQKPNKIIYYKEKNPTEAFIQWRKSLNFSSQGLSKVNFLEGIIDEKEQKGVEKIKSTVNRFHDIAKKVVNDYFDEREAKEKTV